MEEEDAEQVEIKFDDLEEEDDDNDEDEEELAFAWSDSAIDADPDALIRELGLEREIDALLQAESSAQAAGADGAGSKGEKEQEEQEQEERNALRLQMAAAPRVAIVGRPNVGKSSLFNRICGRRASIVADIPGVTRDRIYAVAEWTERSFMVVDTGGLDQDPSQSFGSVGDEEDGVSAALSPGELAQADQRLGKYGGSVHKAEIGGGVNQQVEAAIQESDLAILVVDARAGLTVSDRELANWLRKNYCAGTSAEKAKKSSNDDKDAKAPTSSDNSGAKKPGRKVLVVANKCETLELQQVAAAEFWELGVGDVFPVSAMSGFGTTSLLDELVSVLPEKTNRGKKMHVASTVTPIRRKDSEGGKRFPNRPLRLALVGRPNAGKSSILNVLLGEQRQVVSPVPGTTRDAVDVNFKLISGEEVTLIDTAGIRRKYNRGKRSSAARQLMKSTSRATIKGSGGDGAKGNALRIRNEDGIEYTAVTTALKSLKRADVAALVIDAIEGVTETDQKIAEQIKAAGCGAVIVINKWDLVPDKDANTIQAWTAGLRTYLRDIEWAPVVYTSATTKQRILKIAQTALRVGRERARRVTTATLNMVVAEISSTRPASNGARILYGAQVTSSPPTFVLFVSKPKSYNAAYITYMERQLRQQIGFEGTPIRIAIRSRSGSSS